MASHKKSVTANLFRWTFVLIVCLISLFGTRAVRAELCHDMLYPQLDMSPDGQDVLYSFVDFYSGGRYSDQFCGSIKSLKQRRFKLHLRDELSVQEQKLQDDDNGKDILHSGFGPQHCRILAAG